MSFFVIVFLTIYSTLHGYVFFKVWQALQFKRFAGTWIALSFLIMVITPLVVRFFERGQYYSIACFASYAGYSWMGFLFLFFSILLLSDILMLLAYIFSCCIRVKFPHSSSVYRSLFYAALAATCTVSVWSFFEAGNIQPKTITIRNAKIPKGIGDLTLVQISDVHLGLVVKGERLAKIASLIAASNPDLLVSTGDLVDGDVDGLNGLSELLSKIKPRYGKFAVTGNHEFYAGIEKSLNFTRKSGFRILRGEAVTLQQGLNIAGIDDPESVRFHEKSVDEKGVVAYLPKQYYTILLKHRPLLNIEALPFIDLQLSGHTHRGQIFPFRYLVQLSMRYISGLYAIKGGTLLYVSNGSGTWGPPMRFLAMPEVTIIKLVHRE